jgi:hypothetical protein
VEQLATFTRRLFTDMHPTAATVNGLLIPVLQLVTPLLLVHAYQASKGSESAPLAWPIVPRYALYGAVFFLVLLFGDFTGTQFIYFQF